MWTKVAKPFPSLPSPLDQAVEHMAHGSQWTALNRDEQPDPLPDGRRGGLPEPVLDDAGSGEEVRRPRCAWSHREIEGLPPRFYAAPERDEPDLQRAEQFFGAIGARIEEGGDTASYSRIEDLIRMPRSAWS